MSWEVTKKNMKHGLKKFWHFVWHEDSIGSWIFNIILAFVLIKFLIYPGIGLALGTNLPVVAVISESMEHRTYPICQMRDFNNVCTKYYNDKFEICGKAFDTHTALNYDTYWKTCGSFYENISITSDEFKNYPMHNGFNKGDIIVLRGVSFDSLKIGDILVYQSKLSYPIIHRVIAKADVIETKGDHNPTQIQDPRLNEKYITSDEIIGKAWLRIPYLGYVKIFFSEGIQCITFNGCSFG